MRRRARACHCESFWRVHRNTNFSDFCQENTIFYTFAYTNPRSRLFMLTYVAGDPHGIQYIKGVPRALHPLSQALDLQICLAVVQIHRASVLRCPLRLCADGLAAVYQLLRGRWTNCHPSLRSHHGALGSVLVSVSIFVFICICICICLRLVLVFLFLLCFPPFVV